MTESRSMSFWGGLQERVGTHVPRAPCPKASAVESGACGQSKLLEPAGGADSDFHTLRVTPNNNISVMGASELLAMLDDPANLLFSSPCGDIQRNLDVHHLDDLKQFQYNYAEQHGCYLFPSVISIGEYEGRYAVIDGQHRLEAVRCILYSTAEQASRRSNVTPIRLPVSFIKMDSPGDYDALFVALNKGKPVQLYRNWNDWKHVLKGLETYFYTKYSDYIKTSETPLVPHINLDKLLAFMDKTDVVSRIGLGCEDLVNEIEELNNCYRLHWRELIQATKYVQNIEAYVDRCKRKNPSRPLFLGIYRKFEWLKRIELKVKTGKSYLSMRHVRDDFRPKIMKRLRCDVWKKRNAAQLNGTCFCCGSSIDYDSFECGHIVAVSNLGATTLKNLEPVCRQCNRGMGSQNMGEYKEQLLLALEE